MSDLPARAVNEIEQTENEVQRSRTAARISQFVDCIFFLIYGLPTIRLLEIFAARENAGLVKLVKLVTGIFYAPCAGITASPTKDGLCQLPLPSSLRWLHIAINGLLRLLARRKNTIRPALKY